MEGVNYQNRNSPKKIDFSEDHHESKKPLPGLPQNDDNDDVEQELDMFNKAIHISNIDEVTCAGVNTLRSLLTSNFSGRVVRASASGNTYSGLIPSRVKPMTLKSVFTASLLDVQH